MSPAAPLCWPTGFREEVPLGLPAHWAGRSRRSLPSGRQSRARLDARFVRPTPELLVEPEGSSGSRAAWRRVTPTWSAGDGKKPWIQPQGGWGAREASPGWRLGERRCVCVSVCARGSVSVILHLESTWGRNTVYEVGEMNRNNRVLCPEHLSFFPCPVGRCGRHTPLNDHSFLVNQRCLAC